MIALKVNNQWLELDERTKIRWEVENSLFSSTAIPTGYSFPFSIIASKKNKQIFEHSDIVEVRNSCQTYSAELHICGVHFFTGELKISDSVHGKSFKCTFGTVVNDFTQNLSEFDLGGNRTIQSGLDRLFEEDPSATNNFQYPDRDMYFGRFTNQKPPVPYIANNFDNLGNTFGDERSPQAYLAYVIKQCAKSMGLDLQSAFFNDKEIADLIIWNPEILLPGIIGPGPGGPAIYWPDLDLKNHVPPITYGQLLNAIKNMFCLQIDITDSQLIITSFNSIVNSSKNNDFSTKAVDGYSTEHVQNNGYALAHTRDANNALIEDRIIAFTGGTIIGEYATIALLPGVANDKDIAYIVQETAYYIYNISLAAWEFFSYNYYDLSQGDEECSTVSEASTGLMDRLIEPIFEQTSRFYDWHNGVNFLTIGEVEEYGLVLFFRRGWHLDAAAQTYPLISSEPLNYNLSDIGNYSLRIEGAKGLYNVWWKDFLELCQCNKTVTRYLCLGINDIINFDRSAKVRIDKTDFIWKKMSFQFTMQGIKPTKFEGVKI